MINFEKEFKKKTSVNFYYRTSKAIMITDDNIHNNGALSGDTIIKFMLGGNEAIKKFVKEKGYSGIEFAEFYFEKVIYIIEQSVEEYNDANVEIEAIYLFAKPKKV